MHNFGVKLSRAKTASTLRKDVKYEQSMEKRAGVESRSFLTQICANARVTGAKEGCKQKAGPALHQGEKVEVRAAPPPPQIRLSALLSCIVPSIHLSSTASQLSGLCCSLFMVENLKTTKQLSIKITDFLWKGIKGDVEPRGIMVPGRI